jgi:hypothetical protein
MLLLLLPQRSCRQVRSLGNACGTIGVIHSLANLAKSGFPILGTQLALRRVNSC